MTTTWRRCDDDIAEKGDDIFAKCQRDIRAVYQNMYIYIYYNYIVHYLPYVFDLCSFSEVGLHFYAFDCQPRATKAYESFEDLLGHAVGSGDIGECPIHSLHNSQAH